jgi:lipopolysaccharide transport system ATP-binding protein
MSSEALTQRQDQPPKSHVKIVQAKAVKMSEEIAISLRNVSKCYKRYEHPVERLKELFFPAKSRTNDFWALRNISLDIPKGQTVGIIGRNGSGKSTLLQIVAGTLTPTSGEVQVGGRVSALLELGSGFNPEFTGRQNVFFNGRLLGLSQTEIENKFDQIAAFADIGDFIDQPVKTYSSGMFVRLAFSVAVNVDPEILIVDEALAVGDIVFQHRCMLRMRTMMDSGVTTLFVSHDPGAIKTLCNSAVMIHNGEVYSSGLPNSVIIQYMKTITELELEISSTEQEPIVDNKDDEQLEANHRETTTSLSTKIEPTRRGSGKARIESVKLINYFGEDPGEVPTFMFNEAVTLIADVHVYEPLQECIIGFLICDKNGNEIIGSNTLEENCTISNLEVGSCIEVKFKFNLPLRPSSYSLTIAGAENYSSMTFDWIDNAVIFQVLPPHTGKIVHALVDLPISVEAIRKESPVTLEEIHVG